LNRFALARYNPDGNLDNTFSGDGILTTDFTEGPDARANAIAIDASGRIVVAGRAAVNNKHRFALARYNLDGSLDATFSSDGKLTTDFATPRMNRPTPSPSMTTVK
jgi:uncharacterized delta-60 repeat protein